MAWEMVVTYDYPSQYPARACRFPSSYGQGDNAGRAAADCANATMRLAASVSLKLSIRASDLQVSNRSAWETAAARRALAEREPLHPSSNSCRTLPMNSFHGLSAAASAGSWGTSRAAWVRASSALR